MGGMLKCNPANNWSQTLDIRCGVCMTAAQRRKAKNGKTVYLPSPVECKSLPIPDSWHNRILQGQVLKITIQTVGKPKL